MGSFCWRYFIVSNFRIVVRLIPLQNTHQYGFYLQDVSSFSSDSAGICGYILKVSTDHVVLVALQKWCPGEEICSENASDGLVMTACLSAIGTAKNHCNTLRFSRLVGFQDHQFSWGKLY